MPQVFFRYANESDYAGFYALEQSTWRGTGLEPISEKVFLEWTRTNPAGFFLALDEVGNLVGHSYSQVCDFDFEEQRSYWEVTGEGTTVKTHNAAGSCVYVVSVSSVMPGIGRTLIAKQIELTAKLGKRYCVGACRIPGLREYLSRKSIQPADRLSVMEYAERVQKTASKRHYLREERLVDPVLTPFLRLPNMELCGLIENFSDDLESCGWATVIRWANPELSLAG